MLSLSAVSAAQNAPDSRFGDQNATHGVEGNPVIPGLFADPAIEKFGDTFYLYNTTDGFGWATGRWVTWTSKDLVNWSFKGESFPSITAKKNWAPGRPVFRNGKYWLPFTMQDKGYFGVSDKPEGPFTIAFKEPFCDTIDGELFIDDDGTPYVIYGAHHTMIRRMKPDLSAPEGEPLEVPFKQGYVEGPLLFKRNGIYYACAANLGYAEYRMIYATSDKVMGPYKVPTPNFVIAPQPDDKIWGVGHGNVFHVGDDYYVVYLRSRMGEVGVDPFQTSGNVYRQICIDRLSFNDDGSIRQVEPTRKGVGPLVPLSSRGTNLALGKTATASSSLKGYEAGKAIDGSFGTRWVVNTSEPIVPTAEQAKVDWQFTETRPADDWPKPTFDASGWKTGPGGFGAPGTPGSTIGTEWRGKAIWARRSFTLTAEQLKRPLMLRLHHDDQVEVYLNGVLATTQAGFVTNYRSIPIAPETLAALKPGENTLAVHCTQEAGGQFVDAGINAGPTEAWWQLDLGETKHIERTEISFNYPTELTPYTLTYSSDGQTWQTFADHSNDDLRESPKVDAKAVDARYFRLRFSNPVLDEIPAGLWEFKAFDAK
ncbi:MAG: family 43 glycosylhydrolase [Tepidisphaeraceae bacterium]